MIQSKEGFCSSGDGFVGYLHKRGWAVYRKKETGEEVQTIFAYLEGLTIYMSLNENGRFYEKTVRESEETFCEILEQRELFSKSFTEVP